jgi:hypothetical protein
MQKISAGDSFQSKIGETIPTYYNKTRLKYPWEVVKKGFINLLGCKG